MKKISILLVALFQLCYLSAQPADKKMRSYHENWVRYLMADIALGGDINYYRAFTDDANSIEAIRRIGVGIQVLNKDNFERKMIPGKNMRVVNAGTGETIGGQWVILSTDGKFDDNKIRLAILCLQLGGDPEKELNIDPESITEAKRMFSDNVRITNIHQFERRNTLTGEWNLVSAKTGIVQLGCEIRLSSDVDYDEDLVNYMLADICLGGPVGFYSEVFDKWNDPNAAEAVHRWNEGVRIKNISDFERIELPGSGIKIVKKGTLEVISGDGIEITN